jgi:hypothetical protein
MAGYRMDYNFGNVRLSVRCFVLERYEQYFKYGNRFGNDRLAGIGDAQDDLDLNNIVISAGVLFPMRYLEQQFQNLRSLVYALLIDSYCISECFYFTLCE